MKLILRPSLIRIKRHLSKTGKAVLAVLLLCLVVRLLPYFAPIHAADIAQTQLAMQFSDRHGLPLGTLLTRDQEHTAIVPLNQISPQFINAILAAEDGSFYHHGALDMKAVIRAIKDAIHAKRVVSGASTITMQLARMLDPLPRNLSGKLSEIWLSWRLTAGMNKNEILSAYINRLPMGGNIYGVEAAARTYFSISASDLNLAQASLLAAIPNNPTYFNPYQHWERLKTRQKYVLNQMVIDGYITHPTAERIYTEKVVFQSRQKGIIAAPHFLFWLATQRTPPLAPPRKRGGGHEGNEGNLISTTIQTTIHPRKGGGELESTTIQTTIDRPLQQFVEAQVQQVISALAANNVHDAAALVIDNHTGEVLAYVGSPDYFNEVKLGRNDGVQALRQPGSTLKPFVYELALEKGVIRPNTILADVPSHYAIPGAKLYSPTDYTESFLGPVRVRVALANSLNVPAVRVLEKVGVQTFLTRLHQLGFEHLNQTPEYYGLGLTLGSGEVSLWELARAYVTMARQGEGTQLVTTFSNSPQNLISPTPLAKGGDNIQNSRTWQLITDMLSDRHARATSFGVDSVLNLPFPTAVKTGTSSNFRDTWTVGFSSNYTVATWVGNFNGEPMRQVSGVTGAAPLWNRIMLHLHEHQEPAGFLPPEGLVQLPICTISGLRPTPDCTSVVQEYFYPEDKVAYENQHHFQLPSEYNEWLARQQQSSFAAGNLRILSPHNGDLFLLYPGETAKQKLEFKLAGTSAKPVEWWLNGEKLATQSTNSFFWQLRPGNWTLAAKSGEMSDKVSFQVELSAVKPTRRGFSLVNSPVFRHSID
ncbi:membrane carboxypeptidase/penicillin-binding protein PbpC [Cylindrospermum stagnale PCC 7417]|uniref:Membrane carboxypeptidase/penicillin-binding protein PbpC n=1 Tax=Cylindrospermum stagnale PCC 7417 TaxID=56107 RepID=K9WT35_9NOST|nr:transglycosylase domain-containing protein [Cylindrospermum stagnale]AFZ22964.1 membrane carboxypeptidase/penicillin-binding protein PbpC [Cylindrospermum stagnale PCC 7417]